MSDVKICPFMSGKSGSVACTDQCKLYRSNRKGYECMFQELQAISWNGKKTSQNNNMPPQGY